MRSRRLPPGAIRPGDDQQGSWLLGDPLREPVQRSACLADHARPHLHLDADPVPGASLQDVVDLEQPSASRNVGERCAGSSA